MKPLEDFIDGFHSDFGLLNQALKKDGFGPKATGAASGLWAVFVRVVRATDPRKSAEPWMLVRDLAIHLSHNVGDAAAASALIERSDSLRSKRVRTARHFGHTSGRPAADKI